jgi:hypothetical protein
MVIRQAGLVTKSFWTTRTGQKSRPYQDSNSDPAAVQPLASRYTDCAIAREKQIVQLWRQRYICCGSGTGSGRGGEAAFPRQVHTRQTGIKNGWLPTTCQSDRKM